MIKTPSQFGKPRYMRLFQKPLALFAAGAAALQAFACYYTIQTTCAFSGSVVDIGTPPNCNVPSHVYATENWMKTATTSIRPNPQAQGYSNDFFEYPYNCHGAAKIYDNCNLRYHYFTDYTDPDVVDRHYAGGNLCYE